MVFSSPVFLFLFLPVVFAANKLLPVKARNYLLILASLFFYAWGEPVFVLLMLGSVLANYLFALGLGKGKQAKLWLALCVVFNIGMLFVFKYANFFADNINGFFGLTINIAAIRLPIGISFYTFQAMSYVIDVYRGTSKPQKNLGNVLLYISFFPQLIAGPIVKYHDIDLQIQRRAETPQKTAAGLRRFTVGLLKKLIIANTMGAVADSVFALSPDGVNAAVAWVGAISYSIQIYFDFSGYSDMALGLAGLFGFELKENFLHPYISRSVKEFWRRWHVSLSTWFKEYLYIPLGGNRKGAFRTGVNLTIVFLCTGFWHGAEWTFVVWGLIHGVFMLLERGVDMDKLRPKFLGNVYTLLVAVTAFTIFRAATLEQGFTMIGRMFTGFYTDINIRSFLSETLTPSVIATAVIAVIAATPFPVKAFAYLRFKWERSAEYLSYGLTLAGLFVCMFALSSQTYNPFIYFRF
ncbi:MAG: MBOAT family protein [Christensenellales bacterium]